jgi:hypothetical protein
MKKEQPSSTSIIKDFINFSKQNSISKKDLLKEAEEHQRLSLSLYDASKKLLDKYGEEHTMELAVGAGRGIYGMHFDSVGFRSTPMIPIETEKGEMLLTVTENYTTGSNYYKNMDRIEVNAYFDMKWTNLFNISQTKKETKSWSGKKAAPEQMIGARDLLSDIEKSLKEKYGEKIERNNSKIKPATMVCIKEMESILLGKRKTAKK